VYWRGRIHPLRRIGSSDSEKIVCRISREATQIGYWGEQIPSEIVVKVVDKSCHSPLWWAAIRHAGRFSPDDPSKGVGALLGFSGIGTKIELQYRRFEETLVVKRWPYGQRFSALQMTQARGFKGILGP
jgi:hypothetical protein